MTVLVAEEDGVATGVAAFRSEWLDALYVLPQWWNRGVGRALHDEVLARQRAGGCERCHLWVLEHNPRARRFYERLGWVENGSSRVVPFPPKPIDVGYRSRSRRRRGWAGRSRARPPRRSRTGSAKCVDREASR